MGGGGGRQDLILVSDLFVGEEGREGREGKEGKEGKKGREGKVDLGFNERRMNVW